MVQTFRGYIRIAHGVAVDIICQIFNILINTETGGVQDLLIGFESRGERRGGRPPSLHEIILRIPEWLQGMSSTPCL